MTDRRSGVEEGAPDLEALRGELAQRIRMGGHLLESVLGTGPSPSRAEEREREALRDLLEEWDRRGFPPGPDREWARRMLGRADHRTGAAGGAPASPDGGGPAGDLPSGEAFLALARTRRSVRRWRPEPVPREVLDRILEAALWAPSAFNRSPWTFYVRHNDPVRAEEAERDNAGMTRGAPVRIYLGVDERLYEESLAPAIDAGMAAQNLLLAAAAEGLGACPLYQGEIVDQDRLRAELGAPPYVRIHLLIVLGWPAEAPEPPARPRLEEAVRCCG